MKKAAIIGTVFVFVLIGVLIYSTSKLAVHKVEVCMEFNGMTRCSTASGATEENALRAATTTACALIASGVTDSVACGQATPKKVTWLK